MNISKTPGQRDSVGLRHSYNTGSVFRPTFVAIGAELLAVFTLFWGLFNNHSSCASWVWNICLSVDSNSHLNPYKGSAITLQTLNKHQGTVCSTYLLHHRSCSHCLPDVSFRWWWDDFKMNGWPVLQSLLMCCYVMLCLNVILFSSDNQVVTFFSFLLSVKNQKDKLHSLFGGGGTSLTLWGRKETCYKQLWIDSKR